MKLRINQNTIIRISLILICGFEVFELNAQSPGSPTEYVWSQKTDSGWKMVMREKITYDDQSRIAKQTGSNSENGERHTKTVLYLSDTVRIEIDSEFVEGKFTTEKDSIVMSSNGDEISYRMQNKTASNLRWNPVLKRTIVKDDKNNIVKETYARYRDGKWNYEDRMLYLFENGQCTQEIFQMREDEDWITRQKSIHTYDQEGKRTSTDIFEQNKTSLIPEIMKSNSDQKIEYSYDKAGNPQEHISKSFVKGKWVEDFKKTYIY